MLNRYNPRMIEEALRDAHPPPPFPPATDRTAWRQIRDEIGEQTAENIIQQAEAVHDAPIPPLPATLYLEVARRGVREGYEAPASQRRQRLGLMSLAECLEGNGRFLDPLLDLAWAICEESSWALPAHQHHLADPEVLVVDLGVAMTAMALAELDALVGDQLDPALGVRIRHEVNRRCFVPFLTRHDFHWMFARAGHTTNNWTAVCSGGIGAAALYLESDPARLAEILGRALRSLDDYLASFDPEGGSSEGPGYWSYGFGYYVMFAQLVEQRTDGKVNLLDGEPDRAFIRDIARYPLRTVLSPGHWTNFSDCVADAKPIPMLVDFLARRLEIPELAQLVPDEPSSPERHELSWQLRHLFWRAPVAADPASRIQPARHDWYQGLEWMIARHDPADPAALVLAAKGGNNAENHNQNDAGNIIVHLGGESLIADPGAGRYTKAYFGPERYTFFVNSSLGHSVPVVNGQAQRAGREHAATVLGHHAGDTEDMLALELKDAYPKEADIATLRRTITLHRDSTAGAVSLSDEVRFATAPGNLESVLITFGRPELHRDTVLIHGDRGALRVTFDPEVVNVRHDIEREVEFKFGTDDVQRLVFALREPAQEAQIAVRIEPV